MPWGRGSGCGFGFGFGRGWGAERPWYPTWSCRRYPGRPRRWRALLHPGAYAPPDRPDATQAEVEYLKQQAAFLKQQLEAVEKRLGELEK
jgi:hypothetical protein